MTYEKNDEIIKEMDKAISDLVYEKARIIKAYNYYNGKRDPEQFRHLEENFGIGSSTSVEFNPLVRKHIDVLIGEYLSTPLLPKISCKDKETLSNIFRDTQLNIHLEVVKKLGEHLNNNLYAAIQGKQGVPDEQIQAEINNVIEDTKRNFISDYEIAGQNIVSWMMQDRNIDFDNKRKLLLLDLLISGTCYYKVRKSPSGTGIELEVLNPTNAFIERNVNSPYLKNSPRSVYRRMMTKAQILNRFGKYLSKDDLDSLDALETYAQDGSTSTYIRSFDNKISGEPLSDGVLGGFEITPILPYERGAMTYFKQYPVYEVEWIKTDKVDGEYVMNRYEGIRIGSNIYIPIGLAEDVIRSTNDKTTCTLSMNGMFCSDRNNDAYSLILATANLQDKYDVICFYLDNLIAESGTKGDFVDMAFVPKNLGADLTERLMKWKAYKKGGLALLDSSQEGNPMNTMVNGFDDRITYDAVNALEFAKQSIEAQCSSITGVFRERLNGIEQKDAVTNIQVGVKNSALVTKQYYQTMDLLTREILLDSLDLAKKVFKNGISGSIILGTRLNKIFTALPEHYTVTDFDIQLADSSETLRDMEYIKQYSMELAKNNMIDPEITLTAMTATGLTQMREDVTNALLKKRMETNQLGQLQQQLQQAQQQLQQLSTENQKLQQAQKAFEQEKLKFEREKLAAENKIEMLKIKQKTDMDLEKLELDKNRVKLEGLQLIDNNSRNDEIKND